MTNDISAAGNSSTVFDGWRSISIALFMALVGYSVMISVPVLSTALVAHLGYTALELHLLPKMSMNEIYLFFVGLTTICALFIRWIPARPLNAEELELQEKGEDHLENWHVPEILPVICLIAVCFTYINIGGYYTYVELAEAT